jgi:hypothetical protein
MVGAMSLAALAAGVMLSWSAPPPCPGEAAVRSDVEALLLRSLDEPFARSVDVRGTIRREGRELVLEITGDGSGGPFSRTLKDVSCDALAEAAALIVALAIDPSVLDPPHDSPPEPPPAEAASAEVPPTIEYVEPIAAAPASGLPLGLPWPRLGLSAFGAIEGGVHPSAGAGVLIGGALLWRYLRLEGLAGYWFERGVKLKAQPSSGAEVSLIAAGGRACPTLPWVVEASVCLGVDLGQLRVDPIELPGERSGRDFWAAAVLGAALAWEPVEALAIRASAEGFWSVVRPSYAVAGAGELHRPARFGGRGLLGIEVRFF